MTRLWPLLVLLMILGLPTEVFAFSKCKPTAATHERWPVKTRKTPKEVHPKQTTVAGLIAEDLPDASGFPDKPLAGSDEENIYSLGAYVMLVKRATDDCDIHMEVADTPDPSAPRVIVEVPPTLPTEQARVAKLLGLKSIPTGGRKFTAANAKKLHFLGYGFFDLSHHANGGDKAGESHGSYVTRLTNGKKIRVYNVKTILELHPTFGVIDKL